MKQICRYIVFLTFIVTAHTAFARSPGPGWITKYEISRKIDELGFGKEISIEPTKKFWKATVEKNGRIYTINFDPYKGILVERFRSYEDEEDDESDAEIVDCRTYTGVKCNRKK
ncbi:PepSY domain-containing protein [Methylobacterium sp. E-041]|uniref:PepSY domain-containing protein n=1 Tax=Methylobacterium sp. E-041 TaxID=2836573 RepID=UPI001FB8787B|nr:PepSY domain-containing protein [Methylobacterium sp. E-041]MCJ2104446.1 PepSY domain-containing protein [Methylobacterium sp. E-041]